MQKDVENENNALFAVNVSDGSGSPLTDARRSILREAARPIKGCKCGSLTHEFVNDTSCLLYRDVKQYRKANSINTIKGKNVEIM